MPDKNPDLTPNSPGTNTKTGPGARGIDPSAPNTGTSNWGGTTDERQTVDTRNDASQSEAEGAGDVRRTSYPQNEAAQNPAAESGLNAKPVSNSEASRQASQQTANTRAGKTFRCADVGRPNCNWSVVAAHEDEIVNEVRRHARKAHNQEEFTEEELRHVREAIRGRAA